MTFNLVTEPWIPVQSSKGNACEVSLRGLFSNLESYPRLLGENPIITACVYRFLLAILHRVGQPETVKDWVEVWNNKSLPITEILQYLDRWETRLDLFHPDHPFMQTVGSPFPAGPIQKLLHEASTGNNPVFWTHSQDRDKWSLSPSEAVRGLLAMQFSGLCGLAGPGRGNFVDGPLIGETVNVLEGGNLFSTLTLNLLSREVAVQYNGSNESKPWWETGPNTASSFSGLPDYLTRPTRAIHLKFDEKTGLVSQSTMLPAPSPPDYEGLYDPMFAYDLSDEKKGPKTVNLRLDRAAWRDASSLLSTLSSTKKTPALSVQQLYTGLGRGSLKNLERANLRLLGSIRRPGKAVLVQWRDETLHFRVSLLREDVRMSNMTAAIEEAESAEKVLGWSTRNLARLFVETNSGSTDPRAIDAMYQSIKQSSSFWGTLGKYGPTLLLNPEISESSWHEYVADALDKAFELASRGLGRDFSYKPYGSSGKSVMTKVRSLRDLAKQGVVRS